GSPDPGVRQNRQEPWPVARQVPQVGNPGGGRLARRDVVVQSVQGQHWSNAVHERRTARNPRRGASAFRRLTARVPHYGAARPRSPRTPGSLVMELGLSWLLITTLLTPLVCMFGLLALAMFSEIE